ncbi:MAG: Fic family protein [Burkholderiales bacterium]|jgi:Fic family protein|nr:Fic family protein [Burkholderiales bacterium]
MKIKDSLYIWQRRDWTEWRYNLPTLIPLMTEIHHAQGVLLGRLVNVLPSLRSQAGLLVLTDDVLKTSEIEGELLNAASVRSSLAKRLGIDAGAVTPIDRHVDGIVEMVLDATSHSSRPLSQKRLFAWHAALFPTGYSGMDKIRVGKWRDDSSGAMQVVSGPIGRRKVHFEAPPAHILPDEIKRFLGWANQKSEEPELIKAGLAHLWFVTLHPFDDGNGRIARAVSDLFLARADGCPQRLYSLSAQLQRERKDYYNSLELAQKGGADVTDWLLWFLGALSRAVNEAHSVLDAVLMKSQFWQQWATAPLNERQVKLLNRLLDGFSGKLTTAKWASIAHCSHDTALRDINQLLALGALMKSSSRGRNTAYELPPVLSKR